MRLDHLTDGIRTRLLRVAAGFSQHDLASRAGIDRRRLSEHERGERPLPAPDLSRVRLALEASDPTLVEDDAPGAT